MDDLKNASHRVSVKIICKTRNQVLLIKAINKDTFNLIGGGVDKGESIEESLKREFQEETGVGRNKIFCPKLLHVEIKQFAAGGQFDAVVNIFFVIEFTDTFNIDLEKDVYEQGGRFTKDQLNALNISEHSNKDLILSTL